MVFKPSEIIIGVLVLAAGLAAALAGWFSFLYASSQAYIASLNRQIESLHTQLSRCSEGFNILLKSRAILYH